VELSKYEDGAKVHNYGSDFDDDSSDHYSFKDDDFAF